MPLFFVVGAVSQYAGAAVGVTLFETTAPSTVAWLRAAGAAVVLLAWRRPWRRRWTRPELGAAAMFGIVTLAMNVAFYESIARIPLGTAVAIEFTGPVAVAVLGSRRPLDYGAAMLVAAGVYLLAGPQTGVHGAGVAFALLAAALWAGYILLGKRVADAGAGVDSLAVGMGVAAVLSAPVLLGVQGVIDASVLIEARTWLLGAGVGVLSSAIPYALDQPVLARVGRARFALLLALLPATAAVVGAVALAQRPDRAEIAGIALVMAALVVSARAVRRGGGLDGTIEP
ncbi:EamA family transporter [Mycolicibacterium chubuense]|uniref:Threonine/homoserine exporter RhtA n=1 Tax=Mycolicibacterium chubuense TaxID=1800 RepID=A0A0J6YK63_MYCCU|nr:EamA family transporter [Mycolicibacterium chubuense]KMO73211.1 Threonine/homoserine exporter RhtA [Mycolicibacterium chubuense]ORA56776.1 EamA family transporter [Mycolicibacterium chubuense]SPX98747.1 Conserved hypthetical membrane protein [Mycolicibacterium chubuense]